MVFGVVMMGILFLGVVMVLIVIVFIESVGWCGIFCIYGLFVLIVVFFVV